jgi:hypothetical protein
MPTSTSATIITMIEIVSKSSTKVKPVIGLRSVEAECRWKSGSVCGVRDIVMSSPGLEAGGVYYGGQAFQGDRNRGNGRRRCGMQVSER